MDRKYDVITLGEILLRLSTPINGRLAQLRVVLLATAIEAYHPFYRPFFPFDAIHPISPLRSVAPASRSYSAARDVRGSYGTARFPVPR